MQRPFDPAWIVRGLRGESSPRFLRSARASASRGCAPTRHNRRGLASELRADATAEPIACRGEIPAQRTRDDDLPDRRRGWRRSRGAASSGARALSPRSCRAETIEDARDEPLDARAFFRFRPARAFARSLSGPREACGRRPCRRPRARCPLVRRRTSARKSRVFVTSPRERGAKTLHGVFCFPSCQSRRAKLSRTAPVFSRERASERKLPIPRAALRGSRSRHQCEQACGRGLHAAFMASAVRRIGWALGTCAAPCLPLPHRRASHRLHRDG